jgi:hypothetical protein
VFQRGSAVYRYHDDLDFDSDLAILDTGTNVFTLQEGISLNRSSDAGQNWSGLQATGFSSNDFDARLIGGRLALVYADFDYVWYTVALDDEATSWSPPQVVAGTPAYWPGTKTAQWLLEHNGEPAVLWSDGVDIHFALHAP